MTEYLPIHTSISGMIINLPQKPYINIKQGDELVKIDAVDDKLSLTRLKDRLSLQQLLMKNAYSTFRESKRISLQESVDLTEKYVSYLTNIFNKAEPEFAAGILNEEIDFYQLSAEKKEAENNLTKAKRNQSDFELETSYDEMTDISSIKNLEQEIALLEKKIDGEGIYKAPFNGIFFPVVSEGQYVTVGTPLFYLKPSD